MSDNVDFLAESLASFGEPRVEQKKTGSCIFITEYFKNQILQINYSGKLEFVLILLEFRRMKRHTAANMYLLDTI